MTISLSPQPDRRRASASLKLLAPWGSSLSLTRRAVLMLLADRANADWRCWPSVETIAAFLGKCEKTVRRALLWLEEQGLLSVRRRYRQSSIYTVHLDALPRGAANELDILSPEPVAGGPSEVDKMSSTARSKCPPTPLKEPRKEEPEAAPLLRAAPQPGAPPDPRSVLFSEGLGHLRRITGKPESTARGFMGLLLRELRDDCPGLLGILQEALDARPVDPSSWLLGAVRTKSGARSRALRPHALDNPIMRAILNRDRSMGDYFHG